MEQGNGVEERKLRHVLRRSRLRALGAALSVLAGWLAVGGAAWASGGIGLEAFAIVSAMMLFLGLGREPPRCRAPPLELIASAAEAEAAGVTRLWNIFHSLAGQPAAGPLPLFVCETAQLDAALLQDQEGYAVGVAVSRGMLAQLDDAELGAVLEHELAHARDGRAGERLMSFIDGLSASLGMFAVVFLLMLPLAIGLSNATPEAAVVHGGYAAAAFVGALFCGCHWGPRMRARVAQERELRADAGAAAFTSARDMEGALGKIVGPPVSRTLRQALFCQAEITHPSLQRRLTSLKKLR